MKHISDNIVTRIKDGNTQAYKEVYLKYYKPLCVYIMSFTHDKNVAEDVAQITLIKLWEHSHTLKEEGSLNGFLYRVAYNEFISIYRKRKKYSEALNTLKIESLQELATVDNDIIEQQLILIQKAIDELPAKRQEIFILCKKHGKTYQEIAQLLGISKKTVENQIGKALKSIREKVKYNNHTLLILINQLW